MKNSFFLNSWLSSDNLSRNIKSIFSFDSANFKNLSVIYEVKKKENKNPNSPKTIVIETYEEYEKRNNLDLENFSAEIFINLIKIPKQINFSLLICLTVFFVDYHPHF